MGVQNNYSSAARKDSGGDRVTPHNGGYSRARADQRCYGLWPRFPSWRRADRRI